MAHSRERDHVQIQAFVSSVSETAVYLTEQTKNGLPLQKEQHL